jgi:Flp pilus assembly protein protease CpaA
MKKARQQTQGEGALDLVEAAIHLLRRTPVGTHLVYHLASAPFVLGLLWFWSDMTRGAHADDRLAPGALILTLLYVGMKTGQSAFCSRLRESVGGHPATPWTLGRFLRLLTTQAALQPFGFVLFPLSVFPFLMLPTPWLLSFFQGVSVSGDRASGSVAECARAAFHQTRRWPGQNHGIVGLLILCGSAVFLDVIVGVGSIPFLARTLFGLTSDFNLSVHAYLNTTVILAFVALTYLVMDPFVKAIYVLRTFEVESIHTGDDLRSRLATLRRERITHGAATSLGLLLLVLALAPDRASAQSSNPPPPATPTSASVDARRLDDTIRNVLSGVEYSWRSPRELSPEEPEDPTENRFLRWIRNQFKSFGKFFERNLSGFFDALERLLRRIFASLNPPNLPTGNSNVDWKTGLNILLYGLLGAGILALGWLLFKRWRNRKPQPVLAEPAVLTGTPDLQAEEVSADQLPEDGWLNLAGEMAAKGEWRLAQRALYLAALAHLAQREFVRLAPSKSNHDYHVELRRRARAHPGVQEAFTETASAFDRVWYGNHPADQSLFETARDRVLALRTPTQPS